MIATRSDLLRKGLSAEFADVLARRYIHKLEQKALTSKHFGNEPAALICSMLEFFDAKKDNCRALNALHAVSLDKVRLNYQTWQEYTQQVALQEVQSRLKRNEAIFKAPALSFEKPRPQKLMSQQARGFSTQSKMTKDQ